MITDSPATPFENGDESDGRDQDHVSRFGMPGERSALRAIGTYGSSGPLSNVQLDTPIHTTFVGAFRV